MATISDVARLAGTTPTTVSHALSGKRPVSQAMRERIAQAIATLDYQPSVAAQTLATGRTHSIVMDVPISTGTNIQALTWHLSLAAEFSRLLTPHGYRLLIVVSDTLDGEKLVQMATNHIADGFILPEIQWQDPRVDALSAAALPFVMIGRPKHHRSLYWADADSTGGGEAAAAHLLDLGHRNIVFISRHRPHGMTRFAHTTRLRQGILAAYQRRGLDWPDKFTLYVPDDSTAMGYQTMLHALDTGLDCTAVITGAEWLAIGVMTALRERGRRIPQDISVIGTTSSPLDMFVQPALTMIEFPHDTLSAPVIESLLHLLQNRDPAHPGHPMHTLLPTSLIVRQSTAAVPLSGWQSQSEQAPSTGGVPG